MRKFLLISLALIFLIGCGESIGSRCAITYERTSESQFIVKVTSATDAKNQRDALLETIKLLQKRADELKTEQEK